MRSIRAPLLLFGLGAALALASCGEPEPPRASEVRVLLLGLEGADPEIVDTLVARGDLPAFARLQAEGARGKLAAVVPLLPPVAWTCIATGRKPADTGVHDYTVQEPATGRTLPVHALLRRTEALWDILSGADRRVGVVAWPCTWPVEPVNGFMVSDRMELLSDRSSYEDYLCPPDVADLVRNAERSARGAADALLGRFLRAPPVAETEPVRELRRSLSRAEAARAAALALWSREAPDFMAWYCELPGEVSQRFLPYAPPRMEGVSDREVDEYGAAAEEAYRYADGVVADALAAADEDTVVLVVSNHGMRSGRRRPRGRAAPDDRLAIRWRRRFGALYAWGKGVRPVTLRGADSMDVAPTVLGLLGLPAADDMPGRFLSEAFEADPPEGSLASYENDRLARIRRILCGEEGGTPLGTEGPLLRDHPGATMTLIDPLSRGTCELRAGDRQAALRSLHLARVIRPADARILFSIASLWEMMKRPSSAAMYYRDAIKTDPGFAAARIRLASVLWKMDRKKEALAHAARAVATEPTLAEARLQFGRLLLEIGRVRQGERQLLAAAELEPDFLEVRNHLGIQLLSRGLHEEAAVQFQAAVDLDPDYPRAWNNLGVALLRHADRSKDPQTREATLDRALLTLDEAVERFPDYPKPYFNRARLRVLRNQRDLAAVDARRALDLDPDYEEARRLLRQLGVLPSRPR